MFVYARSQRIKVYQIAGLTQKASVDKRETIRRLRLTLLEYVKH